MTTTRPLNPTSRMSSAKQRQPFMGSKNVSLLKPPLKRSQCSPKTLAAPKNQSDSKKEIAGLNKNLKTSSCLDSASVRKQGIAKFSDCGFNARNTRTGSVHSKEKTNHAPVNRIVSPPQSSTTIKRKPPAGNKKKKSFNNKGTQKFLDEIEFTEADEEISPDCLNESSALNTKNSSPLPKYSEPVKMLSSPPQQDGDGIAAKQSLQRKEKIFLHSLLTLASPGGLKAPSLSPHHDQNQDAPDKKIVSSAVADSSSAGSHQNGKQSIERPDAKSVQNNFNQDNDTQATLLAHSHDTQNTTSQAKAPGKIRARKNRLSRRFFSEEPKQSEVQQMPDDSQDTAERSSPSIAFDKNLETALSGTRYESLTSSNKNLPKFDMDAYKPTVRIEGPKVDDNLVNSNCKDNVNKDFRAAPICDPPRSKFHLVGIETKNSQATLPWNLPQTMSDWTESQESTNTTPEVSRMTSWKWLHRNDFDQYCTGENSYYTTQPISEEDLKLKLIESWEFTDSDAEISPCSSNQNSDEEVARDRTDEKYPEDLPTCIKTQEPAFLASTKIKPNGDPSRAVCFHEDSELELTVEEDNESLVSLYRRNFSFRSNAALRDANFAKGFYSFCAPSTYECFLQSTESENSGKCEPRNVSPAMQRLIEKFETKKHSAVPADAILKNELERPLDSSASSRKSECSLDRTCSETCCDTLAEEEESRNNKSFFNIATELNEDLSDCSPSNTERNPYILNSFCSSCDDGEMELNAAPRRQRQRSSSFSTPTTSARMYEEDNATLSCDEGDREKLSSRIPPWEWTPRSYSEDDRSRVAGGDCEPIILTERSSKSSWDPPSGLCAEDSDEPQASDEHLQKPGFTDLAAASLSHACQYEKDMYTGDEASIYSQMCQCEQEICSTCSGALEEPDLSKKEAEKSANDTFSKNDNYSQEVSKITSEFDDGHQSEDSTKENVCLVPAKSDNQFSCAAEPQVATEKAMAATEEIPLGSKMSEVFRETTANESVLCCDVHENFTSDQQCAESIAEIATNELYKLPLIAKRLIQKVELKSYFPLNFQLPSSFPLTSPSFVDAVMNRFVRIKSGSVSQIDQLDPFRLKRNDSKQDCVCRRQKSAVTPYVFSVSPQVSLLL